MGVLSFTQQQIDIMTEMWANGATHREVAIMIGEPIKRVRGRHHTVNRVRHYPTRVKAAGDNDNFAQRICLRCKEKFESWGIGNRICEGCRVTNRHVHEG
tara:strand:+ start:74 stop:373 length:300 start_codon:yes stop_codon:yes gene_type:complete